MRSRSDEIREYLSNTCPAEQDVFNPKVYAHLKGISGCDYLFCDFNNIYGYALILLNQAFSYNNKKMEYEEVSIEYLIEDEVIIMKKSKYLGKRIRKVKKIHQKGA